MKVKLIGKPGITDPDGNPIPLPGRQTWAILVRLLMAGHPISRSTLARELFCEAADPLGALRWCLASLRRAFGRNSFRGDPVELNLPPDVEIDLRDALALCADDVEIAELLEGVEPAASAEFSTWLLIAREQVASRVHEGLRQAAIEALACGKAHAALRSAERAVRLRPLDEGSHVLLVKALAVSGRGEAALAHVEATERIFMRELGERPSPALRHAARGSLADPYLGVSETAEIESLIRRGTAALSAGAVEVAFDCLRQAARRAETGDDARSIASAFHELGAAYVHAQRGFDDEGAILLRRAADAAKTVGETAIAAASLRELGYLDALAGRRPSAARHLAEALRLAEGDADALAGVHATTGFNLVDWGQHEDGLSHYECSLELARACGNRRREIWSLGIGGWAQLRAGRAEVAERWLESCLTLCDELRWVAFEPWPRAALAEARLALGHSDNSTLGVLQRALALSGQLGDPCWEAANARAISLVQDASGDHAAALRWLDHARAMLFGVGFLCGPADPDRRRPDARIDRHGKSAVRRSDGARAAIARGADPRGPPCRTGGRNDPLAFGGMTIRGELSLPVAMPRRTVRFRLAPPASLSQIPARTCLKSGLLFDISMPETGRRRRLHPALATKKIGFLRRRMSKY